MGVKRYLTQYIQERAGKAAEEPQPNAAGSKQRQARCRANEGVGE